MKLTVTIDPAAPRITDSARYASGALDLYGAGAVMNLTVHPDDYAAFPPQLASRIGQLIRA